MFERVVLETTSHRWFLAANALYPDEKPVINWAHFLPPGIGTKHQRVYLMRSVRQFIVAQIEMPSLSRSDVLSHATVIKWVNTTKRLVSWMIEREIWRFSQLSGKDLAQFLVERSKSMKGDGRSLSTVSEFIVLLTRLWELRHDYVGSLNINPATLEQYVANLRTVRRGGWKAIDESVALPLIRDAIQWIDTYGPFVLHALDSLYDARSNRPGTTRDQMKNRVRQIYSALDNEHDMAAIRCQLHSPKAHACWIVRNLITQTEGACFIVLLFLVGLRCRELTSLNSDSLILDKTEDGQAIYRLHGIAAKRGGTIRTWVASDPVVKVVGFLERMYSRGRIETGQKALLLSRICRGSAGIGLFGKRMSTGVVAMRIKRFSGTARWNKTSEAPKLHPHSARKTFARFVVLRDKRALESLSYHFGHTHRLITDGFYVGSDIELEKMISEEGRRDLANGLEDILRSGAIGGKAGNVLSTFRRNAVSGKFRGRRALSSLVDKLIEEGIQLAPCDWGYCVYSQSLSACRGSERGPNEANRSSDICSGCANFVATERHRVWWSNRLERDAAFLCQSGIAEQSRQWVKKRMIGTEKVLRQLNKRRSDEIEHPFPES